MKWTWSRDDRRIIGNNMKRIMYKIKNHPVQSALIVAVLSAILFAAAYFMVAVATWKGVTRTGLICYCIGGLGVLAALAYGIAAILRHSKPEKQANAYGIAAVLDVVCLFGIILYELYDMMNGQETITNSGLAGAVLMIYGIPLLALGTVLSFSAWLVTKDNDSKYNEETGEEAVFSLFKKKKQETMSYDREHLRPVIRCSICTGEQLAGFRDIRTGKFEEIMLIENDKDLETFKARYGITEIRKEY